MEAIKSSGDFPVAIANIEALRPIAEVMYNHYNNGYEDTKAQLRTREITDILGNGVTLKDENGATHQFWDGLNTAAKAGSSVQDILLLAQEDVADYTIRTLQKEGYFNIRPQV